MSKEKQGDPFRFLLCSTCINSIWQPISPQTSLLGKHFRELSIDGHRAMNQNILVVYRPEHNRCSTKQTSQGSSKQTSRLDEWLSLCSSAYKFTSRHVINHDKLCFCLASGLIILRAALCLCVAGAFYVTQVGTTCSYSYGTLLFWTMISSMWSHTARDLMSVCDSLYYRD